MKARLKWFLRAFVLLVAVAFALIASDPHEEPWHSEILSAEFTADTADQTRSFDDYLDLEERLFAELETRVVAQVATGPEMALVRYSSGSLADPANQDRDWNRSFELAPAVADGAVLLLHGMSDSPYSLRQLGKTLAGRGYYVLGLRLPGHGTAPSGLKRVTWQDMAAAVELAMRHLAARSGGKPVHIIGYSTGAPLALDFALTASVAGDLSPPASLVLVSPAIGIHPAAALARWKAKISVLPGLGGHAWLQMVPEFDPFKYNSFATNAGAQVHALTRAVADRLTARAAQGSGAVLPPTLVFKSTVDATVSTDAVVDGLLGKLRPDRHELVLFDVNRVAAKSTLMVADPGPLTERLMLKSDLPFGLTLVANENAESRAVVAFHKPAGSGAIATVEALGLAWPPGVISLSHVALPFPPDDPLYGQRSPDDGKTLFLGQMAIKGERDLLLFPADWLLRLRHNPFYSYLEERTVAWLAGAAGD